ncbi:MAG: TRAP transporter substrate-binding protein [Rhodospirillales bacterium]|nr:TRAP transporter substrate-binding protein [Rhodospirillales bacterium]
MFAVGRTLGRAVASAAVAVGLALPSAGHAETLKLAHFVPPFHVVTKAVVDPLVNGVKKDSGGELDIKVYPGGELGKGPVEQYVRAINGVADITWGLHGYTSSQFPKSMIVEMPGVVEEAGSGYEAIWRAYDGHLKNEYPGTIPLALWASEPMVLMMRDKIVRKPSDLAGLKIRVSGSVPAKVIEALGATPVQMPAPGMYNALQTNLIDGILTGSSVLRDFKIKEVANVVVEGPLFGRVLFYLVMNEGKYKGLSGKAKAAIDANSGAGLSKSGEVGWQGSADAAMASMHADSSKKVIKLSAAESKAFNDITLKVRAKMIADMDAKGIPASKVLAKMTGK